MQNDEKNGKKESEKEMSHKEHAMVPSSEFGPPLGSDPNISRTSFKRWHMALQTEHTRLQRSSFTLWKCCEKTCRPCRWFDSIDYDKKTCKCCFKFRTFKTLGVIILVATYSYIFLYSIFKEEVLPKGTIFFFVVLVITAYIVGYILMVMGLPPMLGHLAAGIAFENIPPDILPRNDHTIEIAAKYSEKILLVIALIRAGLLLDVSRIQYHVAFIFQLAFGPFLCEFILVFAVSHFLLRLAWDWSGIQGSVLSVVSLASVTSIMSKNKFQGYGEDKDLCTVLVAAGALNVVFALFCYAISVTYALPEGGQAYNFGQHLLLLLKEIALGLSVGAVSGLLFAFFPDKRNTEAAALRILVIAVGSFGIANIFSEFKMVAAAALGCLTMCIIAGNMWAELGWHRDNNPVQYFYSMVYYFSQPVVLSLQGYTMNFKQSDRYNIGLSIAVLFIGLVGREITCFIVTGSKTYPLNIKERIFICIAWFSKGTFQLLLAGNIHYIVVEQKSVLAQTSYEDFLRFARTIKETTMISILMATPLAYFSLTLLSPKLLTKQDSTSDSIPSGHSRRRSSMKYFKR